jgi:O-antigen/teichoic acid export membrane protein
VVWLALAQAATTLLVSHAVAGRPYRLVFDAAILKRLIDFGWPIWLSAFPLIAVYHGDRIVIGRLIGIEDLAGYSAAFMVAMVPGLVAAKVGQSLMLPVFAAARDDAARLARRFAAMTEATAIVAAVYLATAMLLGGFILEIAFGPNYAGLGGVMAWLAAMWAMRMLQAVPGMALLAAGQTKPFLVAGFIRASALVPAALCAASGWGLEAVAASGFAGELASLVYISRRMDREAAGLSGLFASRVLFLVPAALAAGLALALCRPDASLPVAALALLATLSAISLIAVVSLPETRSRLRALTQP